MGASGFPLFLRETTVTSCLPLWTTKLFQKVYSLKKEFPSGVATTVELQWLVYHGCFELILESLGKNLIAADIIIFGII